MKNILGKIAVPVSALLLTASPSFAIPTLTITSGASTMTFSSASPIVTGGSLLTIGTWKVSEQAVYDGSPIAPFWDLDIFAETTKNGTLTSTFTYDNLAPTALSQLLLENGGSIFPVSASVTVTAEIFKNGNPLVTLNGLPGPNSPVTALYSSAGVYSLSETVVITSSHLREGNSTQVAVSSDSGVQVTPIPDAGATFMLLGSGLTALGLFGSLRKSKN